MFSKDIQLNLNLKVLEFSKKLFELSYNQYSEKVKDLPDFFKLYAIK